jgi:putative SOS response-associated peptidase YedK
LKKKKLMLLTDTTPEELYTFTIITTEGNALLRLIQNRIPVIYDKEMGQRWLDGSFIGSPITRQRKNRSPDRDRHLRQISRHVFSSLCDRCNAELEQWGNSGSQFSF